jgi:hypothetical protein
MLLPASRTPALDNAVLQGGNGSAAIQGTPNGTRTLDMNGGRTPSLHPSRAATATVAASDVETKQIALPQQEPSAGKGGSAITKGRGSKRGI